MNEGDFVRIIQATDEFYQSVSTNGPDPYALGNQGTIIGFGMNAAFETGWMVRFARKAKVHFFHEEELEQIEKIEGPVMVSYTNVDDGSKVTFTQDEIDALPRPEWWKNSDQIKVMKFQVEVEGADVLKLFGPYLRTIDEVHTHLEKLLRGDK